MVEIGRLKVPDPLYELAVAPRVLFPVHGAIAIALAIVAARGPLGGGAIAAGVAVGLTIVTLVEYAVHRFLFHSKRRDFFLVQVHVRHHARPHETKFGTVPLPAGLAIIAVGAGLALAVTWSWAAAGAVALGLEVGYLFHESTHYLDHRGGAPGRIGRWLKANHDVHHLRNPRANFGFMTLFWDRVFGTYQAPDAAERPR
jgi:sterol desaturase/sphingolipid hydroxylase (fatty acid hydroxylase superfamily)